MVQPGSEPRTAPRRALDDRSAAELLTIERPAEEAPRDTYIYYPNAVSVPEGVAVNVRGRSYKILRTSRSPMRTLPGCCSPTVRALAVTRSFKERKLYYVYNFLGIAPEQVFESKAVLKPGKYTLGMEFERTGAGENGESVGKTKLYIDDQVVASGDMRTQPAKFTLSGDGLCGRLRPRACWP